METKQRNSNGKAFATLDSKRSSKIKNSIKEIIAEQKVYYEKLLCERLDCRIYSHSLLDGYSTNELLSIHEFLIANKIE